MEVTKIFKKRLVDVMRCTWITGLTNLLLMVIVQAMQEQLRKLREVNRNLRNEIR